MTFVCLSIPPSATDAGSLAELGGRLLAVAPRLTIARAGIVWADGRGLDAVALAHALLASLAEQGIAPARAGVASTPIAAQIAAQRLVPGIADDEPVTVVPRGTDRAFVAPCVLPAVPMPAMPDSGRNLAPMLTGLGLLTCRDLAALDQESVEIRLGRDGVALWQLARADDARLIFGSTLRLLPEASLEWTDYVLTGGEPLAFVVNALLNTVCDLLLERGEGACAMTLEFTLAGSVTAKRPLRSVSVLRSARPTADRAAWRRQMRRLLEVITLDDAVIGATLRVDTTAPPPNHQGDLFDPGFGTAAAVEQALARVTDEQPDAVVVLEATAHPLVERQARWAVREQVVAVRREPLETALTLQLLPEARSISVRTEPRGGFAVPTAYSDTSGQWEVTQALGPDCASGGHWDARYAREYYQCIRDDGMVVLLYRDALAERWVMSGWWD